MAYLSLLIITFVQVFVTDARLDMTFISQSPKITVTEEQRIHCVDTLSADGDIVQEFGRVIYTGAGDTGTGASGPSNYTDVFDSETTSPVSGLPVVTNIVNTNFYLGHYMFMASLTDTFAEHVGVFYCDTNTTDERNDHTRIQQIVLAQNAVVKPLKRTVTINAGESVTLEMQATNGIADLRWLFNESPLPACDDQSSCNVNLTGIYECYYDEQHNLGNHGIMRVIVRDCPAEMWSPSSGCDKVCVECINGGVCDDEIGDCVCPPGFNGTHCQETCGIDRSGITCGLVYFTANRYFCLPDPYGCSCATGYTGETCQSNCDNGYFGADCVLECHCATGGCDQYTGVCDSGGCATGWSGYNCQYISTSIVSFTNEKVNSGEQATFTCVIEAYPRPLESQIIIERTLSSGSDFSFTYTIDPSIYRVTVVSSSVAVSTGENYTCGVSNSAVAGSTVKTITIDQFIPPTLVNGPNTTDISNTQVTVRWTSWSQGTDLGDGPVSMYRVYYRLATQSDLTLFGETNGTSLTVTGLEGNTTYHFAVTAYRDTTGWGDYSPSTQATTLPYSPPVLVNGPNTTDIGSTQVTVRWTSWSQDTDSGDGPVSMYRVYYKLATQSDFNFFDETTGTSLTVTGLQDNTTYHFAVTAYRDTTGWGDYSPSTPATTLCSIPGPAYNLEANETTAESVYLTWQQPIGTNCMVMNYTIGYELTNRDMCEPLPGMAGATSVGGSATSFNYTGLEPYSKYTVTVEATGGNGEKISLNITTRDTVPSSSPVVTIANHETENLTISWSPVECGQRHGNITSYDYELENVNTSTIVESGSVPADTEEVTFHNLSNCYYHGFRIRASTSGGSGDYSQPTPVSPKGGCEEPAGPSDEAALTLEIIVAVVVAVVVTLLAIPLVLVVFIRYKRRIEESKLKYSYPNNGGKYVHNTPSISLADFEKTTSDQADEENRDEIEESSAAPTSSDYENVVAPVKIPNLTTYIKKMRHSSNGFSSEFKSIPPGAEKECNVAGKPQNKNKNRYINVIPYDDSRVVLVSNVGDTGSDYINASYIDGYNKANAFIASQGPNKETVNDFWQMVWQENTATILMTTKCVEAGKIKCEEYWPSGEALTDYGDVLVKLVEKESTADYIIRTFQVSIWDAPNSSRVVRHFQFLVWPDMGVPVYTSPVIFFLRRVRTSNPPEAGPIIIHCSAGVGRTGTLIAICNMLDMKDDLQEVDVHGCVKRLREQRVNMVQTQEQYEFIYSALLEVVLSGDTSIAASSFSHQFAKLKELDPTTGKSGLESEFETLENLSAVSSVSHYKASKEEINKNKNRFATVFALDRTRPRLVTTASEASDYINANFVDGYSQRDAFIATQMPLPQTVTDFWGMVADYHSCTIVMLGQIDPSNESLIQYWPKEEGQGVDYGPLSVTLTSESDWRGIVVRDFALNNRSKDSGVVRQFQVGEVGNQRGDSVQILLDLMSLVEKWQQQSGNRPITVQCINGLGLSGVYCAVTSVCERAKVEQFIDVFQTVKSLRVCRTGMVETLEQYTMCYDVAMRYLASFDTYANFQ